MLDKIDETIGFVSIIFKIISNPIQNTLNIASQTSLKHTGGFLSKCIAIYASIGVISKVTITNNIISAIATTTGLIVLVFIQILLTYYGLRFFSQINRSGADYAKLICVAQGCAYLIIGITECSLFLFGFGVWKVLYFLQIIILVPYWALTLGRFWKLNPFFAYFIYLVSMLPAFLVIIFILFPMMEGSIYF